jgi:hypothetical protein
MVRDKSADRAVVMASSILMVMECDSHYGDKKANEQERKKLLIHKTTTHNFLKFHYMAPNSSPFLCPIGLNLTDNRCTARKTRGYGKQS